MIGEMQMNIMNPTEIRKLVMESFPSPSTITFRSENASKDETATRIRSVIRIIFAYVVFLLEVVSHRESAEQK